MNNEPINVLRDKEAKQLTGVNYVTTNVGKAQGKEETLIIEYSKQFDDTYTKLEESVTMEVSTRKNIMLKDKDGEIYVIDSESGEPLIRENQDAKKAIEVVNEFKQVIKEFGLKLFNEMLEEKKHVILGFDNTIDHEQVKMVIKAYMAEKEEQEAAR